MNGIPWNLFSFKRRGRDGVLEVFGPISEQLQGVVRSTLRACTTWGSVEHVRRRLLKDERLTVFVHRDMTILDLHAERAKAFPELQRVQWVR